jgi:hypothetical protein
VLECFGPLLILAGLMLAFYALVLRPAVLGDRWHAPLKAVAQKFRGVYESGGWFGAPRVRFRDATGGVQIDVRSVGHGRPQCCILLDLPGLSVSGQIAAAPGGWNSVRAPTTDTLNEFILYTDQPVQGQALMSDGVRWILTQLQHTPVPSDLFVEFAPARLLVRKGWYSSKVADWERYVGLTLGLRDQLLLASADAIAFATAQPTDYHAAKCPFCGEVTTEQPVLCRACRTPHHRECWEANAGCSMYGCKESLYVLPQPARWLDTPRPNKPR